jgi:hypothetical protein
MDLDLARLVGQSSVDFCVVAVAMQSRLAEGVYGDGLLPYLVRLSPEECENRWKQLDAQLWSELPPGLSSLDIIHKIFIKPAGEGPHGHGTQPSFDQLRSLSASCAPSYLKVPTNFPIASADVDDDDLDDEDVVPIKIDQYHKQLMSE